MIIDMFMNFAIFIIIFAMILFGWIIIRSYKTGEIYTKWGLYTGKWFISKEEDPNAYKVGLYLYSIIYIIFIIMLIIVIFIEIS